MSRFRRCFLIAPAIVAGLALGAVGILALLPPRLEPWAQLDVRDAPAPLVTRLKLAHLQHNRSACDRALATAGLRVQPVKFLGTEKGCPLYDVVHVAPENKVFGRGFHATCPLAVGLAMVMRHVVQPASRRHLGADIARIEHLGTFSCRPIRNGRTPSPEAGEPIVMSEHAIANAIDITGFTTTDGRTISVGRHWRRPVSVRVADAGGGQPVPVSTPVVDPRDAAAAAFLREVRDGACGIFHAVLGPDYNALHRGHFHFDMGRYRQCR